MRPLSARYCSDVRLGTTLLDDGLGVTHYGAKKASKTSAKMTSVIRPRRGVAIQSEEALCADTRAGTSSTCSGAADADAQDIVAQARPWRASTGRKRYPKGNVSKRCLPVDERLSFERSNIPGAISSLPTPQVPMTEP